MFGNTKNTEEPKKSTPVSGSGSINALVKGSVMEGTLRCETDLRIDGTLKGKLHCQAKVIIGPSGVIEGEIRCQNAVIEGRFKGTLQVSELLNVRETAEIDGDITTGKLLVQSGAKFNVSCHMDGGSGSNGFSKQEVKSGNHAAATTANVAGGKAEVRN
jgi:cytoskeletal protein CcmA (bactofilin family)